MNPGCSDGVIPTSNPTRSWYVQNARTQPRYAPTRSTSVQGGNNGRNATRATELYLPLAAGGLFRRRRTSEPRHRDDASSKERGLVTFARRNNRGVNGERASTARANERWEGWAPHPRRTLFSRRFVRRLPVLKNNTG